MPCTVEQRSARGYCPDNRDGHTAEMCATNPSTSWCSGPSIRECADGSEVPEDQTCPIPVTTQPTPAPLVDQQLPATGAGADLALAAAALIAAGSYLVRRAIQ